MKPSIHDDFERTQEPNLRVANEYLHAQVTRLENKADLWKNSADWWRSCAEDLKRENAELRKKLYG